MKKLLILLFPILISYNSYGSYHSYSETICVDTDAQETGGIIYLPNKTKPFTGKNLCKYENGQKKSEGNFKDGKKDGKRTSWNENGQIEVEENFKDGKLIDETYKEGSHKPLTRNTPYIIPFLLSMKLNHQAIKISKEK